MATGLSVSDVISVDISLAPVALAQRSFGTLCIIGASDVINVSERIRSYTTLDGVATDFGTSAPEYLAAVPFFGQSPQPSILYIGRWAYTASAGILDGAVFGATQQASLLTALQAITTGSLTISIDGTPQSPANLDFSAITNLNGAASVLTSGLTGATCTWNANLGRFQIESSTTGSTSTVSYATDPGTGPTLATDMGLTQASGASTPVAGIAAETPLQAVTAIGQLNADIYGMEFAYAAVSGGIISDQEFMDVAAYIEGASPTHIFGITIMEPSSVDGTSTTDLGYMLKAAGYGRTFTQYSTTSDYAVSSIFGRAFTVNFNAANSTITLMFKTEPGIVAETLTETQWAALKAKNVNVFVNYQIGTAILQDGVMCDGTFFDERHDTDWLQNKVQTDVFNRLYTTATKIPQTDPGVHELTTTVENSMAASVNNGMVAPGVWTSTLEFGVLKSGQVLPKGYYVYAPPVATQSQADREARKAPVMQVACKLAGAVHSANVVINVNR